MVMPPMSQKFDDYKSSSFVHTPYVAYYEKDREGPKAIGIIKKPNTFTVQNNSPFAFEQPYLRKLGRSIFLKIEFHYFFN